jgi:hypothetical protein
MNGMTLVKTVKNTEYKIMNFIHHFEESILILMRSLIVSDFSEDRKHSTIFLRLQNNGSQDDSLDGNAWIR